MDVVKKSFSWYFTQRALPYWCVFALDSIIIFIAGMVAEYAVIGGSDIASHFWSHVQLWCTVLPFYWVGMRLFHTYNGVLRYSVTADLMRVLYAVLAGGVLLVVLRLTVPDNTGFDAVRLLVVAVMMPIAVVGMWAMRIMMKYMYEITCLSNKKSHAFVYGAHEGGLAIARMLEGSASRYKLSGFVTTDEKIDSTYLMGVRVFKSDVSLVEKMRKADADTLMISPIQQTHFRDNVDLHSQLIKAGIRILVVRHGEEWNPSQNIQQQQLREVDIEDLLPRNKIEVDMEAIGAMLKGKCILITGAAGSIGSEMVRQVSKFAPKNLVLVDQAETPMHGVRLYMKCEHGNIPCKTIVGNISNAQHMERIFSTCRPEYVFHAAAYKHVPMMEDNPAMAVQNNVYGTRVIADLAVKYGVKKFVMISTDKAVNPTNVMGCSKRICEIYCQSLNREIQKIANGEKPAVETLMQVDGSKPVTQFITTRFGNVLGSNGSVIPLFREQIRKGGPVTVTHPDIIRFFMLIPEACQLVLEAGTMGKGGEIYVFDMGKPVRIVDLAQRMIELSGADNVEIKFTGLRDGEKLYEEVLNDAEQTKPTVHPKIKIANVREYEYSKALEDERTLYDLSFGFDDMAIVGKMKSIVPEYKSQHSKYEALDVRGKESGVKIPPPQKNGEI